MFFEPGNLAPLESKRQCYNKGEACISVQWDWRVEAESTVLYGSSNSGPKIESGIQTLQGKTIEAISVVGQVPELVVRFSNGHFLKSMVMVTGDPEWSIKLLDGRWVYVRAGNLASGEGVWTLSKREEAVFALAERTAARWGVPTANPMLGQCSACASFIPLDGNGSLLDYGCCVAETGPFDGRAVKRTSGCHAFTSEAEV